MGRHSTFQRRIKMKKKQQQIRCSNGASIAGRTDSPLQVTRLFFFFLRYLNLSCHLQFLTQPLFNQTFLMSPPLFLSRTFSKLCPLSSPCWAGRQGFGPVTVTWWLSVFLHRLGFFFLRGWGAQQAAVWTRRPERRRQEETKSYTFTTEATQRPFSKVSIWSEEADCLVCNIWTVWERNSDIKWLSYKLQLVKKTFQATI